MTIFKSKLAKVLTIASVVFLAQQHATNESGPTEEQNESLHKASQSCQTWSEQGYGELMRCE